MIPCLKIDRGGLFAKGFKVSAGPRKVEEHYPTLPRFVLHYSEGVLLFARG